MNEKESEFGTHDYDGLTGSLELFVKRFIE